MRAAFDSKAKDEATQAVYRSGNLETFAKYEQRLTEARFSAQLREWIDAGLTDSQILKKINDEPLKIALSTAGPSINGKQPSGSGRAISSIGNIKHSLTEIRKSKGASDLALEAPKAISGKDRQVTVGEAANYGKQTADLKVSTGAENVALYPKLKDQLHQENLRNVVNKNPILEHAAFGNGNLTPKGIYSKSDIDKLAIEWVGAGAIRNSNGGLTSADGTRRYRPPQIKKHSAYAETGIQANFERGTSIENKDGTRTFKVDSNLHLNIRGE